MFKAAAITLCRAGNRKAPAKFNANQSAKKHFKSMETASRLKEEKRMLKQEEALIPTDPLVIRAYKELQEEGFFERSGTVNPFKDRL
ncbi:hypothetical protein SAMD00019534_111390 [Acytostelium subglobosum LB1]|uniref:hypothetical protein n=1 Tax=Acytostelium subglobosum LB1 TaxID=1410327 RepID=UPI000644EA58|nr:hypothetical protein SAMD00019534_111390 [Acytostelium subglobosum LB1]GAM27963.1 hypothetical protein SAMD00019534_111390 [Acytostelium subglobosum LB1]|eukprot:XP_012749246.1 hypothetical protein SAMD00019534_111390 [Acytostelium subglobosum LB1]